jgi:site-specific recombinase XerD
LPPKQFLAVFRKNVLLGINFDMIIAMPFTDTGRFCDDRNFSGHTRRSYVWMLVRLERWIDRRSLKIESLTVDNFKAFLTEQEWSNSSQYIAVCAARSYVRWRYGSCHPLLELRFRRQKTRPGRTLNETQTVKLLSSIDTRSPRGIRDLAMVTLMLDTGLREGEICRLDVRHVDMAHRTLTVICKGGEWETATFFDYTASCLGNWLSVRGQLSQKLQLSYKCFVALDTGRGLSENGLRHRFIRLGKLAGLGALSPHDLRRTFATLALKGGASTRLVQVAGRWKNIQMVERYSRALEPSALQPFSPVNRVMNVD